MAENNDLHHYNDANMNKLTWFGFYYSLFCMTKCTHEFFSYPDHFKFLSEGKNSYKIQVAIGWLMCGLTISQ